MDNSENVQFQSRRLAPILGSVPLRRHRILGGRGMGKGTRAPNRGQFNPISAFKFKKIFNDKNLNHFSYTFFYAMIKNDICV